MCGDSAVNICTDSNRSRSRSKFSACHLVPSTDLCETGLSGPVSIFHRQRPGTRGGQVQREGMNEKLYDGEIQKQKIKERRKRET